MRPLRRRTIPSRVKENAAGVYQERRKPNIPGRWVYVETGDPDFDTVDSPVWLNSFTFVVGFPIAFRHGLDGQTDMIGMYDLTAGAVSGDVAFVMPFRWRQNVPVASLFPIELATDVWSVAVQTVNHTNGNVKVFWPIVADPAP